MSLDERHPGFDSRVSVSVQETRLSPPLRIFVSSQLGQAHMLLMGDLDLATVSLLASKLRDVDSDGDLVIDVAMLTFVDSTGLGILVSEHRRLLAHGHKLTIYAPPPRVQRIFEITGLDQIFTIELSE